jgi:hypothetical protein
LDKENREGLNQKREEGGKPKLGKDMGHLAENKTITPRF